MEPPPPMSPKEIPITIAEKKPIISIVGFKLVKVGLFIR
jgi:hypothetical protein